MTIPANTMGWLQLSADETAKYKLDGVAISQSTSAKASSQDGQSGFELAPGSYTFVVGL